MKRTYQENKSLYESIMRDVAKTVKHRLLNENLTDDSYFNEYVEEMKGFINKDLKDIFKYAIEHDSNVNSAGNEKYGTLRDVNAIIHELRDLIYGISHTHNFAAEGNLYAIKDFIRTQTDKAFDASTEAENKMMSKK